MSDYAHPESLVSTQWVADHLADPTVRFIEVVWGDSDEWGTAAYAAGHIPGAVAWDFATDVQDPVRNDVVDKVGIEALLARAGVTPATTIVVYSGLSNLLTTFTFWLLKVYAIPISACWMATARNGWPRAVPCLASFRSLRLPSTRRRSLTGACAPAVTMCCNVSANRAICW